MKRDDAGDDRDPVEERTAGHPEETDLVNVEAMNYWDRVMDDMDATAAEYESEGWETLELHPGDVTPLSGEFSDRVGLDVLVPDDEYEAVERLFEEGVDFDSYRVYKNQQEGVVYALVAMEDSATGHAMLLPVFYPAADRDTERMLDRAREAGALKTYVRRLQGAYVELTHEDPDLFAPREEG